MNMPRLARAILLNLALLLALALIAEGVAQKCYLPDQSLRATRNPRIFWRTSNLEFNRPLPKKPAGQIRIICMGDSVVAGCPGPLARSYPMRLQALLRARGLNAVVSNLGCPGYTSWQVRNLYSEYCSRGRPDEDILLVHVLCNDSNSDFIDDRIRSQVLEEQAPVRDVLSKSAAYCCLRDWLLPPRPANFGNVFRVPPAQFIRNLLAMQALANSHGSRLIYLSLPTTRWRGVIYKQSIPTLPVPVIRLDEVAQVKNNLLPDEVHFSELGYQAIAENVAGKLYPVK